VTTRAENKQIFNFAGQFFGVCAQVRIDIMPNYGKKLLFLKIFCHNSKIFDCLHPIVRWGVRAQPEKMQVAAKRR
jgi:hypothetical protein